MSDLSGAGVWARNQLADQFKIWKMDRFLEGKIAIVTGGSRGIGYAIAKRLAESGASVAICGRTRDAAELVASDLRAASGSEVLGAAADVSSRDDVLAFFTMVDERFGGLDILVNNAGVGLFRSVEELKWEDWKRTLDVNLSGAFFCSHEALPRFRRRGGGFIINIGSLAGKNAFAGGAAYNASKFGLDGFTEAMMLDHRYDNVRVSTVMPGSVATGFGQTGVQADWKIAPSDIAEIVLAILRMPERTLISRVEVRPSKPPRKQAEA